MRDSASAVFSDRQRWTPPGKLAGLPSRLADRIGIVFMRREPLVGSARHDRRDRQDRSLQHETGQRMDGEPVRASFEPTVLQAYLLMLVKPGGA